MAGIRKTGIMMVTKIEPDDGQDDREMENRNRKAMKRDGRING